MKILIVEDQLEVRETLKDLLEFNGHEVLAAEDGLAGVRLAAQAPDFIFCDVSMPHLNGPGVLAAIKQMPIVRDVPFVFLTAQAARAEQREGMALGADDYITKPFSQRDILDAIAARTKRQHSVQEQVLQLAEQHRRQINAHWSHELLTPLNAIVGCLDLLDSEADTIGREELKEMLGLIREGAERQEQLSQKLICYFRLEQRLHAPLVARDGCRTQEAINAGISRARRKRNAARQIALSADPGEVALDEESLAFAVGEIVDNALNFSPAGSQVTVAGIHRDGRYRIEIRDQGPGLTAEQRASIGAFVQFERGRREQQGLGLGLAIARAVAVLARGTLQLEEAEAGRGGLKVVFDLPASVPDSGANR